MKWRAPRRGRSLRLPRPRTRPALGDVGIPLPVVYGALAIAIGSVIYTLWPKRQPHYRGY